MDTNTDSATAGMERLASAALLRLDDLATEWRSDAEGFTGHYGAALVACADDVDSLLRSVGAK